MREERWRETYVGGCCHLDVFDRVEKRLAPELDANDDRCETLLEEDDVGSVLRNLRPRVDGDSHIRTSEGESIVDSVSHHPDRVASLAQSLNDLELLVGRELGEDDSAGDGGDELCSIARGERRELGASDHVGEGGGREESNIASDIDGDSRCVSCEDLDLRMKSRQYRADKVDGNATYGDTQRRELPDGICSILLGRIEEGKEANEDEISLLSPIELVVRRRPVLGDPALSDRDESETIRVELVRRCEERLERGLVEGKCLDGRERVNGRRRVDVEGASLEDLLDSSLRDDVGVLDLGILGSVDREQPPRRVERHLAKLECSLDAGRVALLGDGSVEEGSSAGLEGRVEERQVDGESRGESIG